MAIATAPGVQHYRFLGAEIGPEAGHSLYNVVALGPRDLPHDIICGRCYLHRDPQKGTRRGLALNARSVASSGS